LAGLVPVKMWSHVSTVLAAGFALPVICCWRDTQRQK
jgi:hypothetical protein